MHKEPNVVQEIDEARQRLAALDRELTALTRTRTSRQERGRILQQRLKAFLEKRGPKVVRS